MKPLRSNFIGLLQLLASPEQQEQYQAEVEVDIRDELVCMWFDDFYSSHRRDKVRVLLTEREREAVDSFDAFYNANVDDLPVSYAELRVSKTWAAVTKRAADTVQLLGWDSTQTVWGFGAV